MDKIYMDHAATTPMHPKVLKKMYKFLQEIYGNPSSIHSFGREAQSYLLEARQFIAETIAASESEIIFTSGGTEADNLALFGVAHAYRDRGNHIITTMQEHQAVLEPARQLEDLGFEVTYIPVDQDGIVSIKDLKEALTDQTILVSVMYANNETGIIQPISEIAELLKDHQAFFHTDAVQAYGQMEINVEETPIDLLTATAHKMNGPKGTGFLYVSDDIHIKPRQFGGEQERKRRGGTENIAGIVGFHQAVQLTFERKKEKIQRDQHHKELFLETLKKEEIDCIVNGIFEETVPSIVNISFPGTNVEQMLTNLDLEGIAASSGSACTAGSVEPSHVLTAMFGRDHERTKNSVRFSFGYGQTEEKIVEAAKRISTIIKRLTK